MLLFYVRHGDPIYNPDSLTPLGQQQAEAVRKRLGTHGIDRIYASSSNRAILTAKPTAEMLKKEITILDWCNEGHAWRDLTVIREDGVQTWGFHHDPVRELFVSEEIRVLGKKWYDHPYFAGTRFKEGYLRIQRETDAFLKSLGYRHEQEKNAYIAETPNDDRIALFAHQGFGLAFLSCLLDIPYPEFSTHFDMGHSGISAIEFENRDGLIIPTLLQLSNDSHIFAERLPLKYQNRIYL